MVGHYEYFMRIRVSQPRLTGFHGMECDEYLVFIFDCSPEGLCIELRSIGATCFYLPHLLTQEQNFSYHKLCVNV